MSQLFKIPNAVAYKIRFDDQSYIPNDCYDYKTWNCAHLKIYRDESKTLQWGSAEYTGKITDYISNDIIVYNSSFFLLFQNRFAEPWGFKM
jgi:hypothetical protein